MKRLIAALLVLSFSQHPHGRTDYLSLDECRDIQRRIDHYTELRKGGGTVTQMESWKRSRQEYKDRFRRGNCR